MKYAYFPGCASQSTAQEYDISTKLICSYLGIRLIEIPNWVCCGATSIRSTNRLLSLALPVLSLSWAENKGLETLTSCAGCFNRLKLSNLELQEDPSLMRQVNQAIGVNYRATVKVVHLLNLLTRELELKIIKRHMKKSLSGLKTVSYYGCLLSRPRAIIEDNGNLTSMDELMSTLGATPLDFPYKSECCGANLSVTKPKVALSLTRKCLKYAQHIGTDCIVVGCPLCQSNLDLRQRDVEEKFGEKFNLPILYFTQVLGLALGFSFEALGLDKHFVSPIKLLESKGLI